MFPLSRTRSPLLHAQETLGGLCPEPDTSYQRPSVPLALFSGLLVARLAYFQPCKMEEERTSETSMIYRINRPHFPEDVLFVTKY
jgi:hypothetical protein